MKTNERARARWYPCLRHRKSKGEWAEVEFLSRAMGLGFTVCRPFGENHRFDYLVYAESGRVSRVQVKSSWTRRQNVYQFKTSGSGRPYQPGEVDFIVVLVVPEEAWYVIPAEVVRGRDCATVSPHIRNSRAKLEKYREEWGFLRVGAVEGPDLMERPALLDARHDEAALFS